MHTNIKIHLNYNHDASQNCNNTYIYIFFFFQKARQKLDIQKDVKHGAIVLFLAMSVVFRMQTRNQSVAEPAGDTMHKI